MSGGGGGETWMDGGLGGAGANRRLAFVSNDVEVHPTTGVVASQTLGRAEPWQFWSCMTPRNIIGQ